MSNKLDEDDEILYRQIHPTFKDNGDLSSQTFLPSSQAFKPTPKDENQLSVDRASLVSAADSFNSFLKRGLQSVAVYGVTVGEFSAEGIDCRPDPLEDETGGSINPAHALADYSTIPNSKQKNVAKRLKVKALTRGQMHPKD